MSKENYEMQFLELMAGLISQTPDSPSDPPVEPQPVANPEPTEVVDLDALLGMQVTAITDEGVTEDAVLASGPPDLSEEEREDLVWKAITEDCPGVGKTAEEPAVIDPLRQRLART